MEYAYMNVLLNGDTLKPPLTGIGRYTYELYKGLQASQEVAHVYCWCRGQWLSAAQVTALERGQGDPKRHQGLQAMVRDLPGAYRLKSWWDQRRFANHARRLPPCLYHEPSYICRPFDGPTVVTVHDLSHIHYPQYHPRGRVNWLLGGLEKSLARADRIITISHYIQQELTDLLGVPAGKVTPIYQGVPPIYFPRDAATVAPVLRQYQLDYQGYLLVVGTLEPRKNIGRLLTAYKRLPEGLRQRFPLVLVGAPGWKMGRFSSQISELERKGQLRRLGYVPEEQLPYIYAGARGLAFPSVYEGFGLPPLEALASGVPVVASRAASIPEVVGAEALLVDPYDEVAMTSALQQLLEDDSWLARSCSSGPQWAAQFSWQRCVGSTMDVYVQLLNNVA